MKNLCCVIISFLISVLIAWGGYFFGKTSQLKDALIANDIVTDELIDASQNILILEMLSEGEIDKVISQINSRLDTQIRIVNNYLPEDGNLEGRKIAESIFIRIAKYRGKYPRKNLENSVNDYLSDLLINSNKETSSGEHHAKGE